MHARVAASLILVGALGAAGCSDDGERAIEVTRVVATGDVELEVDLSCHEEVRVEVDETEERVTIRAFGRDRIDGDCASLATARLREALGDRRVEDGLTGRAVEVVPAEPEVAEVETWDGRATVDVESGEVLAAGFDELIEATQPSWAWSPEDAARVLLGESLHEGVTTLETTSGDRRHMVTVTVEDLPDDSTAAIRYLVVFDVAGDGLLRLVAATSTQRCQPGRGHQGFSTQPCV